MELVEGAEDVAERAQVRRLYSIQHESVLSINGVGREVVPSEVAKSVAWECGVEKGLNAVDGDGDGWLSENVVLVIVRYYSFIERSFISFREREDNIAGECRRQG